MFGELAIDMAVDLDAGFGGINRDIRHGGLRMGWRSQRQQKNATKNLPKHFFASPIYSDN